MKIARELIVRLKIDCNFSKTKDKGLGDGNDCLFIVRKNWVTRFVVDFFPIEWTREESSRSKKLAISN